MVSFVIRFRFRGINRTATVRKEVGPERFTVYFAEDDIVREFGGILRLYRDEGRLMVFDAGKEVESTHLLSAVSTALNEADPAETSIDF